MQSPVASPRAKVSQKVGLVNINLDYSRPSKKGRTIFGNLVPFNWRGWWDFGTGALGDMGCHIIDHPYWALKLGYPESVEASSSHINDETAPLASIITYQFPAREGMPPVRMHWYDGGLKPPRPAQLGPEDEGLGDGGLGDEELGDGELGAAELGDEEHRSRVWGSWAVERSP